MPLIGSQVLDHEQRVRLTLQGDTVWRSVEGMRLGLYQDSSNNGAWYFFPASEPSEAEDGVWVMDVVMRGARAVDDVAAQLEAGVAAGADGGIKLRDVQLLNPSDLSPTVAPTAREAAASAGAADRAREDATGPLAQLVRALKWIGVLLGLGLVAVALYFVWDMVKPLLLLLPNKKRAVPA